MRVWMHHVTYLHMMFSYIHVSSLMYEWVMSHVWMSHVSHTNESRVDASCLLHEWVMCHVWMSQVSYTNESWVMCGRVISHVWKRVARSPTNKATLPALHMTCSIKWFPVAPHIKSEQMRPTKETNRRDQHIDKRDRHNYKWDLHNYKRGLHNHKREQDERPIKKGRCIVGIAHDVHNNSEQTKPTKSQKRPTKLQKRPTLVTKEADALPALHMTCSIKWFPVYMHTPCNMTGQKRPTKEIYKMTITVARDVQHKATPCIYVYTPQHVRAKETYKQTFKRDLQKRPTKWQLLLHVTCSITRFPVYIYTPHNTSEQKRPTRETYKRNLQNSNQNKWDLYKRPTEGTNTMTKGTYKITKETWNYRPTKNAEAYDVEHKVVPYCTPQ